MANHQHIKHIIRITIIFLLVVYFGFIAVLNLPFVQKEISSVAASELEKLLKAEVKIEKIDLGLLNRIIIQNVSLKDQKQQQLLHASRLSAKFDITPLFHGKIRISSVQLFGLRAYLQQKDSLSAPNFQFLLDAFASEDTVKKENNIDLRINTILIRRGQIRYDLLSDEPSPGRFDPHHWDINNLSATLSLKALTRDSINAQVRRLSFNERSGFQLKKFSARIRGNRTFFMADNLQIGLPNSTFVADTIEAHYDSLPHFPALAENINYSGRMHAEIIPSDIKAIVPSFAHFHSPIFLRIAFNGTGNRSELSEFLLHNKDKSLLLKAEGMVNHWEQPDNAYLFANILQAELDPNGIGWLTHNLTGKTKVPEILKSNRYIRFSGDLSGYLNQLTLHGKLATDAGQINANVTMHKEKANGNRSYSGQIIAENLHLGKLLNQEDLGNTAFNVELKGFKYQDGKAQSYIKGNIETIDYKGYEYHHITLDGQYTPGGFNGQITANDPNGNIMLNGQIVTQNRIPSYNLTAVITNFRPHDLHLTPKYEDTSFSLRLKANLNGRSIDDVEGELRIDSLQVDATAPDKCYFMSQLALTAGVLDNGEKQIAISSPFINGYLKGAYSYRTLPASVMQLLQRYIPSLVGTGKEKKQTQNNFHFRLDVNNTDLLSKVFNVPLHLYMPASLHGSFDDSNNTMQVNGHMPEFEYNNAYYEAASLLCYNTDENLKCQMRVNKRLNKGSMISFVFDTHAENNQLKTTLNWGNNASNSYYGKIATVTHFHKEEKEGKLQTHIALQPSRIILNDTVWNIHPSSIDIASGCVTIHDFLFEHEDKFVRANGSIGKAVSDSCLVDIKNIDVQYVIDMVQFKAVKFNGLATGRVHLHHLLKDPVMYTRLNVDGFALNDGLLGKADIHGEWDKELGGIRLNADIREDEHRSTHVTGYVSPKLKGLDLHIQAKETNLYFLTPFLEGIFSDLKGRATGNVRLYGPFAGMDLEGDLSATASVKVNILNTYFHAQGDSVRLRSGNITFKDINLTDNEHHTGIANGSLRHTKLKDLQYNFRFNAQNLLIFNYEKETPDFPFYGKIYATGDLALHGGNNQLHVDGALRSDERSVFTYVTATAVEATSNQFITFVDKTPRRQTEVINAALYHHLNQREEHDEEGPETDIYVNLQIEATPEASMRIIMDPLAGDNITATGNGNLQVNFYNKGDFQMFGNYNVEKGIYKMSIQNVIRKDFILQPGGIVSFNGDPKQANVNVQAVYTVNSASLDDLVADASNSKGNVKVNCLVNLTGNLTAPNLKFDLELPTVSDEDRELVRSLTNTEEQMNTQIIYLLSVGKFYTYDYANSATQSDATSSLAFNTLSGQLNNMLSQVIDNQNWNFGTNLTTGTKGWSDVEAEAILSGSLLNNRLIINGNFGYRDNPMRNTNFVGDFEAMWLLTKNGELRLRGYNQTNDRYFTKSTLTTQGIGLMYKKDFNNWRDLIDWLLLHKRRKTNNQEAILPSAQEKRTSNARQ